MPPLIGIGNTIYQGGIAAEIDLGSELTNLIPSPQNADLTNVQWVKVGSPTVTTTQLTWVDTNGERCREQFFTAPAGNHLLFVCRVKAVDKHDDPATSTYYVHLAVRYWDADSGSNQTEIRYLTTTEAMSIRDDGVYRNYNQQYLAATSAAEIMFDLFGQSSNKPNTTYDYEYFGLYDIEGLTGIWHDPLNTSIRFDLDKRVTWWSDSVAAKQIYPLADLLNVVHNNDGAVGGETSSEILTRFLAAPETHDTPTLIMSGHNSVVADDANGTQIKSDITTMTDDLDVLGTDYRVLTLIANSGWTNPSGAYTTLIAVNSWINTTYGSKAVDIYAHLRTKGDGSANDIADVAAGVMPRSLQADTIHLNRRGKDFMLDYINGSVGSNWRG